MGISEREILHCFQILELDPEASPDEVKRAFRKSVKHWHPDLYAARPNLRGMAEEKIKAVNAAYQAIRAYLALRKKSEPPRDVEAKPDSGTASARFPDPFYRSRIRNIKSLLAAYIKCMTLENQPSFSHVSHQAPARPAINREAPGKDFKEILRQVQRQHAQAPGTTISPAWASNPAL